MTGVQTCALPICFPVTIRSSFSELLGRSATSVTLNEIQGNPFQLDLNYRGQRLSSVLGSAQGISAYLDGVRINEAFGDVI